VYREVESEGGGVKQKLSKDQFRLVEQIIEEMRARHIEDTDTPSDFYTSVLDSVLWNLSNYVEEDTE
jgi:hypothetical protein